MWRSHPVLFTFAIGAALGFFCAVYLMFAVGMDGVLLTHPRLVMLWPTIIVAMADLGGPSAGFSLFISFVSNAILYGFVSATPVGLVVAIRRSLGPPEKPTSIGRM